MIVSVIFLISPINDNSIQIFKIISMISMKVSLKVSTQDKQNDLSNSNIRVINIDRTQKNVSEIVIERFWITESLKSSIQYI